MDLPPEEKQRIYAEEKARQEAQEKVKQERDTKNFKTGCIGCLSIVAIVVLIMVFTGFWIKEWQRRAGYVDLNAQVRFTGTQFVIVNEDSFDWLDVKLEVNPVLCLKDTSSGFLVLKPVRHRGRNAIHQVRWN